MNRIVRIGRWVLAFLMATPFSMAQPPATPRLTFYSPRGPTMLEWPGRKSWGGHLWIDQYKIGVILPGQFLTLELPQGDHALAGQTAFGHESGIITTISLSRPERYFVRLIIESKAVAGFGPLHFIAEPVTCQEAYREAAALQPVHLKRIEKEKSFPLERVVRESYFPECGK